MGNIAVIGCGYWGRNLVRNMAQLGALAAVSDSNAAAAEAMARQYGVPACSIADICADKAVEGVVIATPAASHAEVAGKALAAGKHVLVEKPLALAMREASALRQASRKHRRILMVGHLLQYHPAYIRLKEMVAADIGKLKYIRSDRLSFGKVRTEENVLWGFAPHDFSMLLGLAGELPETVAAQESCITSPGVADIVSVQMAFPGGLTAEVNVSWLSPIKEHRLTVIGDKGMLVFDDTQPWESKLQLFRQRVTWKDDMPVTDKAVPEAIVLAAKEPLREECLHFLNAIAAGSAVRTDGEEASRVLELLTAAELAIKKRGQVLMAPTDGTFVHETAIVDDGVTIGKGSKVWHFSHILGGSRIGKNVIIGQNVMIGPNVTVGDGCKIQNNVSLYKGVTLEEGVFCGPSCVFTNVNTPRAEIERKDEFLKTPVGKGATIGANATIICGRRLGSYCFIGAGAVVTKDVNPHALMVGNPARQTGWVSHAGERLGKSLTCPREGRRYRVIKGQLQEIPAKAQKKRRRTAQKS